MPARALSFTDPACPWSWAAEPVFRRLAVEFGEELEVRWVLGGLARSYPDDVASRASLAKKWLDVAAETRAPLDPRIWFEAPLRSSYPACMAVKAAAEQTEDRGAAYLRALREGIFCFRSRLDGTDALVAAARGAGLDGARFERDLASSATVEAFGADLEAARTVPPEAREAGETTDDESGRERLTFPTVIFEGEDGTRRGVFGARPYEEYRSAAEAVGARAATGPPPGVLEALRRFGRLTGPEVEAVCDLPGPRAAAELWRLAAEWRVRPVPLLSGELWEPA